MSEFGLERQLHIMLIGERQFPGLHPQDLAILLERGSDWRLVGVSVRCNPAKGAHREVVLREGHLHYQFLRLGLVISENSRRLVESEVLAVDDILECGLGFFWQGFRAVGF
ncbi:MAG: hypothetical protein MAG431_01173 [Chloroflexi bacterium]|nr:hypothetical protein [Chloroflexota bacterium]